MAGTATRKRGVDFSNEAFRPASRGGHRPGFPRVASQHTNLCCDLRCVEWQLPVGSENGGHRQKILLNCVDLSSSLHSIVCRTHSVVCAILPIDTSGERVQFMIPHAQAFVHLGRSRWMPRIGWGLDTWARENRSQISLCVWLGASFAASELGNCREADKKI